jgi:tetratricopeptide (TPR) repeat protein
VVSLTVKSVFISSTSKDLLEHREAVNTVINRLEMRAIDMKYFGSRSGDAVKISLAQVAKADIFIGIIAHRYGFVPQGMKKAVTEQEYDEAVRLDIPRLIYLVDPNYAWSPELIEAGEEAQKRLAAFKAKVDASHVRSLFTTPDDLAAQVSADLANLNNDLLEAERAAKEVRKAKQVNPSCSLWVKITSAIFLVSAIISILAFMPTAQDWLTKIGILSPPPMPPNGGAGLNIVVAGLGLQETVGSRLVENDLSREVSTEVYGQVQQFDEVHNHLGPEGIGVQSILGATAGERAAQAQVIAEKLNADVVIYGYLEPIGDGLMSVNYTPEFYLSATWTQLEGEFLSADEFGQSIQILDGRVDESDIATRITALDLFLQGLGDFILGEAAAALTTFEQIIAAHPNIEVVYIFAGNAAARLGDTQQALDYYTRSLTAERPEYSRGLLGRGVGLKNVATARSPIVADDYDLSLQWPSGTPCTQSVDETTRLELMLDLALICFAAAEMSPEQLPTSDIDVKVLFERGDLFAWRSMAGYGNLWDNARQDLQSVATIYDNADAAKKARIRTQAGLAHGFLAQIIMATSSDTAQAITEFQKAIEILEQDVELEEANQMLDYYRQEVARLEAQATAEAP